MVNNLLSRRQFIIGLASIGASVAIPPVDASEAELSQAWEQLLTEPITFEVDEYNTITVPWAKVPEVNADIYYDFNVDVATNKELLEEIESVSRLADYFAYEFEVLADQPGASQLVDQLLDQDLGWEDWILRGDLEEHKGRIDAWLNESINWDYAPTSAGPVGEAYQYFNNFAWGTQEDLGVVVIEGEHPGSSYYAAELRLDAEEANRRAEAMGLPIRFKLI